MLKKAIFLLFILPLLLSAQEVQKISPNGYNKFYYENGVVSSEGYLRDGKPDGYWKTYSLQGVLKSEGNRKNFQLDSIWKFYDEQGNLAFEYNYKAGKKNGFKNSYDSNSGLLLLSESFVDDLKEGFSFEYYKAERSINFSTPQLKNKVPFVKGKKQGEAYEYSPEGLIITITQYDKGFIQKIENLNRKDPNGLKQGVWKQFYPDGTIKQIADYSNDKLSGYVKDYDAKGNLLKTTKYVNGELVEDAPELAKLDVETKYYKGGAIYSTGTYKDGSPEGIHRKFSPEGEVIETKVYSNGVLTGEGIIDATGHYQGVWKEFYGDGKLKSTGEYKGNRKIGEWVYYFQSGKMEQKGTYDKKGRIQGAWRWYYDCLDANPCAEKTGNLLKEEYYKDNLLNGPMVEYSDSGKVITKGEYVENEKEGFWTLELPDYREEGNYKFGKRSGEWKHFYTSNNQLRFIGSFVDGVPDGKQNFYYPNGLLKQTGKYVGGLKDGEWKFYDKSGYLFLTILFLDDVEMRFDGVKVIPEEVQ